MRNLPDSLPPATAECRVLLSTGRPPWCANAVILIVCFVDVKTSDQEYSRVDGEKYLSEVNECAVGKND